MQIFLMGSLHFYVIGYYLKTFWSINVGTYRYGGRRGTAHNTKDADSTSFGEGRPSRRGGPGYGTHEVRFLWVMVFKLQRYSSWTVTFKERVGWRLFLQLANLCIELQCKYRNKYGSKSQVLVLNFVVCGKFPSSSSSSSLLNIYLFIVSRYLNKNKLMDKIGWSTDMYHRDHLFNRYIWFNGN